MNYSGFRKLAKLNNLSVYLIEEKDMTKELLSDLEDALKLAFEKYQHTCQNWHDDFDYHYKHLILLDEDKNQIVGGYRFCLTDKLWQDNKLYTQTLYHISDKFFLDHGPCIELGKAFVVPEYQKTAFAMPLLWKGLMVFCEENSQYKNFIGLVTIGDMYNEQSKIIMSEFAKNLPFSNEFKNYVSPKFPTNFEVNSLHYEEIQKIGDSLNELDKRIKNCEENQIGIPTLFKYYLKYSDTAFVTEGLDPEMPEILDLFLVAPIDVAVERYKKVVKDRFSV